MRYGPSSLALLIVLLGSVTHEGRAFAREKRIRRAHVPPISLYLADGETVKAKTRAAVIERCERHRKAERAKHPEISWAQMPSCEATVVVVRGPYARKADPKNPYEDP